MKIRLKVSALNEALDIVSIVAPNPVGPQGGAGFLFVVRDGTCWLYSRDKKHQMRSDVALDEADTDGSFIFPADKVGALRYLDGWIQIETGKDEAEDRFWVRYETEEGAGQDFSTFDPIMMQSLDDALKASVEGGSYPAALLKEAVGTTKGYLASPEDSRVEEHFQTLQLFDQSKEEWKKGDGFLFAADGIRTCYFFCDNLQGKGLALHGQHLPFLTSFLAKCSGTVTVRHGEAMTFIINAQNQVLGWAHHVKQHGKFSYYSHKLDQFVLKAPKGLLVKALEYVRAGFDKKRDKVRVQYTHEDRSIQFLASESGGKTHSMPIGVKPVEEEGGGGKKSLSEGFAANVNLNHLIELIKPMKSNEVDLRVAIMPAASGRKEAAVFRTIDSFWLDDKGGLLIGPQDAEAGKAFQCQVTRFMPSRE